LLNMTAAPWRARFALVATLALLALVGSSLLRRRLRLAYERWRTLHGVLAVLALACALVHIELVGWYVDLPWKRALWAAMVIAVVALRVYVRIVVPLLLLHRPWMVEEVIRERGRSTTLRLRPVGHSGMRFLPGQFAWLTLGRSPFAIEDHPFSFSSSAEERDTVSFTIKAAGDFSASVASLEPGASAYVEGPHGAFSVDRYEGDGCVFVAGGVGITPIMSMLRTLADRRDPRPHLLVYGARSPDELTFRERIQELRTRLDLRVVEVASQPPPGWEGEHGRIDPALLEKWLPTERERYVYFICGPGPMMDAVEHSLRRAGVPWPSIYSERFNMV